MAVPRSTWHPVIEGSFDANAFRDISGHASAAYNWVRIDAENTGTNCGLQSLCTALGIPVQADTFTKLRQQIFLIHGLRGTLSSNPQVTLNRLFHQRELLEDNDIVTLSLGAKTAQKTDVGFGVVPIVFYEWREPGRRKVLKFAVGDGYQSLFQVQQEQGAATPYILLKNENPGVLGAEHWVCYGTRQTDASVRTIFFANELPPLFLRRFQTELALLDTPSNREAPFVDIYHPVYAPVSLATTSQATRSSIPNGDDVALADFTATFGEPSRSTANNSSFLSDFFEPLSPNARLETPPRTALPANKSSLLSDFFEPLSPNARLETPPRTALP